MKKFIFTTITLCLGSLIAILAAEVLLRIFVSQPLYAFEKGLFAESKEYGYYFTPNVTKSHAQPEYNYQITTNSYGFRGKEPNLKAQQRILVLGDSVAMGQGVAEGKNVTDLAQDYFKAKSQDIDIFSTAISGYSSVNHLNVLKHIVPKYRPHTAICFFYWNDIGMDKSLEVQNGFLVLSKQSSFQANLREWLNNHSRVYCLIKKIYYSQKDTQETLLRGSTATYAEEDLLKTVDYFKRMKSICDLNQCEFIVTLLPLGGIFEGAEGFQKSKKFLIDQMNNQGISFVDWMKIESTIPKEELVFPIDHHWNEKGHEYFSKKLIELIQG